MRGRILAILLFTVNLAFTQTYSVEGYITDKEGIALLDVEVYVEYTDIIVTTNNAGYYAIDSLRPGSYTLDVYLEGYNELHVPLNIVDRNVNLNVELEYATIQMDGVDLSEIRESKEDLYDELGQQTMKDVEGTHLNAGRKTESTNIAKKVLNKAAGRAHQTFNKNPGFTVLQSDAAGIQLDIAARGMDPKRTSNFNTRQNGYDISADALGYPETYYTPVLSGVEEIHVVRGAASLEYGPHFGGLLDFIMKKGPKDRKIEFTSRSTAGSYLFSTFFNSLGGTIKKVNYYTFYEYKRGNGFRPNSVFQVHNFYANVNYNLTPKLNLSFDYTHLNYLAQQPGGLTDQEFLDDASQSTRDSNYFKINWDLFALTANYAFTSKTTLESKFFGLYASRQSLGNLESGPLLAQINARNLIRGQFINLGNETRVLHRYKIKRLKNIFTAGIRLYRGNTNNMQGEAANGDGAVFKFETDSLITSDYSNPSNNYAFYIENMITFDSVFKKSDQLKVIPGYRMEYLKTTTDGLYRQVVRDLGGNIVAVNEYGQDTTRSRTVSLFGIGLSYRPNPDDKERKKEYYFNFTRNFKSITFSDVSITNPNLQVDSTLQDETGFNADLGFRGRAWKYLAYDVSLFYLFYNNRIGTWQKNSKLERTNIGNSRNLGIECLLQSDIQRLLGRDSTRFKYYPFVSFSVIHARYVSSLVSGVDEGNYVEMVPSHTLTAGVRFQHEKLIISAQCAFVGEYYSDAGNTIDGSNFYGIQGVIPSYYVADISAQYRFNKNFKIEASLNNLTNKVYFTRRANAYPGPGIIPAPARSLYLTLEINL